MHDASRLNVDVTYFSDPTDMHYNQGIVTLDVMGSEVRPGGYLVIQSTLPQFRYIAFNDERWEQICSFLMAHGSDMDGLVLPSSFSNLNSSLNIYRRLG